MLHIIFENSLIKATNSAKERTEQEVKFLNYTDPNEVFKNELNKELNRINSLHISNDNKKSFAYIKNIEIEKISLDFKEHDYKKSILGTGFVIAGQPLIKKRFVMAGSSTGTSIASKYLSKALPQKLPVRILGTTVLGRAIGRVVPYVGWTLLAIDIVEIIIEYSEYKNNNQKRFKGGFGGGSFSGGGAGSKW